MSIDRSPRIGDMVSREDGEDIAFGWITAELENGDGTSEWTVAWATGETVQMDTVAVAVIDIGCGNDRLAAVLAATQDYLLSADTTIQDLLAQLLLPVPGSEWLEDFAEGSAHRLCEDLVTRPAHEGFSGIGWFELDLLGKIIDSIQGKEDVEMTVAVLWRDTADEPEAD